MLTRYKTTSLLHLQEGNYPSLVPFTIALLFIVCLFITRPLPGAQGPMEALPSNPAEPRAPHMMLSPKKLDLSLPASSLKRIVQEDQRTTENLLNVDAKKKTESEKNSDDDQHWSSFLPIWAEAAKKRGHELPLPCGISANYFYANRDIDVDSVDLVIRNVPLNLDRLATARVKSREMNWAMRFDAWVLPFMSLYLVGGYTRQHSDVDFDINTLRGPSLPGLIPNRVGIDLDVDGVTYGGGVTFAVGSKTYFFVLDTNYTISDLEGDLGRRNTFDQQVDALLVSPRLGWRGKISTIQSNIWIGGTYWGISQTVDGQAQVPLLGRVDFEVDESPSDPFSYHLGTHIEFTKHFNFVCDIGSNFSDMFSVTPSLMFRF